MANLILNMNLLLFINETIDYIIVAMFDVSQLLIEWQKMFKIIYSKILKIINIFDNILIINITNTTNFKYY